MRRPIAALASLALLGAFAVATVAARDAAAACAPIRITTGGTYSGCYTSTTTGTPAVTLATSAAVTLSHATITAKGFGVQDTVTGTKLTVLDSTFTQTDPGAVVTHRAVELEQPASFVFNHNRLTDTDGVWLGANNGQINPLTIKDNIATNIGRYPHPTSPNCCVQFVQLDHVKTANGHIEWNHTQNTAGQSGVEDNIDEYISGGTDSTHRLQIHHNLIDGAYPRNLNDTGFTGGGINQGDGGGGHSLAHDNTVVSTTNYGVSAHSTDNYANNNLMVNDGAEQRSDFGQAIVAFQNVSPPGVHATGNTSNWQRYPTDPSRWPCYLSSACSGNKTTTMTEQQARDAWAASVPAVESPIGPRPVTPPTTTTVAPTTQP